MERALMVGGMIGSSISVAVLVTWIAAHALDPPDHVTRSWMHELCFNPIPWGAVVFDKDWPKCSRN